MILFSMFFSAFIDFSIKSDIIIIYYQSAYCAIGERRMKSTGFIRNVDYAGRVILPPGICSSLGIKRGEDSLEIFLDGDALILKKYNPGCVFCGEMTELAEYNGAKICRRCREKIALLGQENKE